MQKKKYLISVFKKCFVIIFFNLIFINFSSASKNGMGDLKISDEMMGYIVELYFNTTNKADRPGGLAITKNGDMVGWAVCPARYAGDCIIRDLEPLKSCRENVKKYLNRKENCFMLLKKRRIVWNNLNIEVPKNISDNEVLDIFKSAGLYGDNDKSSSTNDSNQTQNITEEIKKLKKLLDEGVITNEEFDQAKKKILN